MKQKRGEIMKKLFLCLTVIFMLTACVNTAEKEKNDFEIIDSNVANIENNTKDEMYAILHTIIYKTQNLSVEKLDEAINNIKKHDIDTLYKLDLNKTYELNDKILGFCSTFYVAINKLYSSLYEFKFDEIPNSFGFDLQCFLAKYPNFEANDIKIVNLSRFKKISLSHYQKTLDEYLREIHLPKILRSIWPCVVDKNNNLIYFPRFQENYKIRHDIFNIDIKNFLTTFNEEILD